MPALQSQTQFQIKVYLQSLNIFFRFALPLNFTLEIKGILAQCNKNRELLFYVVACQICMLRITELDVEKVF